MLNTKTMCRVAFVTLVAVLLSACGGSDTAAQAPSTTSVSTTAAPTTTVPPPPEVGTIAMSDAHGSSLSLTWRVAEPTKNIPADFKQACNLYEVQTASGIAAVGTVEVKWNSSFPVTLAYLPRTTFTGMVSGLTPSVSAIKWDGTWYCDPSSSTNSALGKTLTGSGSYTATFVSMAVVLSPQNPTLRPELKQTWSIDDNGLQARVGYDELFTNRSVSGPRKANCDGSPNVLLLYGTPPFSYELNRVEHGFVGRVRCS